MIPQNSFLDNLTKFTTLYTIKGDLHSTFPKEETMKIRLPAKDIKVMVTAAILLPIFGWVIYHLSAAEMFIESLLANLH